MNIGGGAKAPGSASLGANGVVLKRFFSMGSEGGDGRRWTTSARLKEMLFLFCLCRMMAADGWGKQNIVFCLKFAISFNMNLTQKGDFTKLYKKSIILQFFAKFINGSLEWQYK